MAFSKKLPVRAVRTSESKLGRQASLCFAPKFFAHELTILQVLRQLQCNASTPLTLFDQVPCPSVELGSQGLLRAFISIDEVGRGCVAGPVVVAASLWLVRCNFKKTAGPKTVGPKTATKPSEASAKLLQQIKDSKLLNEKQREAIFEGIAGLGLGSLSISLPNESASESQLNPVQPKISYQYEELMRHQAAATSSITAQSVDLLAVALGSANPHEIETHNIWGATQLSISRALNNLEDTNQAFPQQLDLLKSAFILFDGSLTSKVPHAFCDLPFVTVIKGDKLLKSVALSSIFAKVYRDRVLRALDNELPGYGFARHKGYGTEMHRVAIKKLGVSVAHRPSFLRNFLLDQ